MPRQYDTIWFDIIPSDLIRRWPRTWRLQRSLVQTVLSFGELSGSMAIWISDEGYVMEIQMYRGGLLMDKQDIHDWVGQGFSIFHLDIDLFMIADLSSRSRGANRNVRAIDLLRHSSLEPLTEIFGDILIVRRDEVLLDSLLSED